MVICGGQSGTGVQFSRVILFPLSVSSHHGFPCSCITGGGGGGVISSVYEIFTFSVQRISLPTHATRVRGYQETDVIVTAVAAWGSVRTLVSSVLVVAVGMTSERCVVL
jgi:hypothetical protein